MWLRPGDVRELVGRKGQCLSAVLKSWKDGRELGWGERREKGKANAEGPAPRFEVGNTPLHTHTQEINGC